MVMKEAPELQAFFQKHDSTTQVHHFVLYNHVDTKFHNTDIWYHDIILLSIIENYIPQK